LDKLKPGALTDLNARRFIEAVKAELHTIQKASDYDQATIVVHIASEIGLLSDFCGWVFLPRNLYQDTPDCIRELQALSITQDTLAGFQDWIREVEILNEWH
jgi:hypothetical protein